MTRFLKHFIFEKKILSNVTNGKRTKFVLVCDS